jgi:hypothetical protein
MKLTHYPEVPRTVFRELRGRSTICSMLCVSAINLITAALVASVCCPLHAHPRLESIG